MATYDRAAMGGIVHRAPVLAACFMIVLLGSIALPLTGGFVGEFLLLTCLFSYSVPFTVLGGLTVLFSSVYMFRLDKASILGTANEVPSNFRYVSGSDKAVFFVVSCLVILIVVFPITFFSLSLHS